MFIIAIILAFGIRPNSTTRLLDANKTAAAPSLIELAFPAVIVQSLSKAGLNF